jgi:hypothetical protein
MVAMLSALARERRLARMLAVVLASVAACVSVSAKAATPTGSQGTVSPLCDLYGVTVAIEVLTTQFNSPGLKLDMKKWPLFLGELRRARAAFDDSRLAPVRSRYDSLVRKLKVVGAYLLAGDRNAALTELHVAAPDLSSIRAQARRRNVVCRSGSTMASIG